MKNLVIIGAGDFGREVSWFVERINSVQPTWNLLGFVDDGAAIQGTEIDGYPVLGTTEWLKKQKKEIYAVCSIGMGTVRRSVMEQVMEQRNIIPATIVDPDVTVGRNVRIGDGCIICPGTILSVSAEIGDHCIINTNCGIGHDTVLEPYCSVHSGSVLCGKVYVGECTYVGTGSRVIQGLKIAPEVILGAGAVVVSDITESGTYVGVPAKRLTK